ncbi:AMP-binding protein [Actinomycetospora sp. NBRC 106378]|uniref:class I adenylate-forming enzyme family protein n=1 Tax=Actinomycetospora sp. NBRC 106378 TaxID=3032208 RepID=UPI0024A3C861|nr:AMP-binding protein [Actinomycetospora sp. NBRC 106378]GLZ55318.1 AMP-binding protein [Actinomycetospora sp. NBRC 106378]
MTVHPRSATERRAAIEKRHPTWVPRTLAGALDAACEEFADRPFVVTEAGTWTYAQMRDWSARVAGGLRDLGVGRGDHVAVVLANDAEFVAVRYAIARLGAVTVPINVANRRDELGFIVRRSDASVLITTDRFRDLDYLTMLDELLGDWTGGVAAPAAPELRHLVVHETGDPRPGVTTLAGLGTADPVTVPAGEPDDVADILFTSGTTGEPKGVQLTHDMLLRTAYGSTWGRAYTDAHRVVFSLPLFHVYGYVEGLLTVPFVGGCMVMRRTFDPAAILDAIEAERADDALLIPTMTAELIRVQRAAPRDLSSLTHLYSSGGVSPHGIWPEIDEVLSPGEVVTGYGMSETTASTTCTWPEDPPERRMTTNGRMKRAGVAGDPALDGRLVEYKVIDTATGEDLPNGSIGELVCRGPGVTAGYYRNPEATAAAFTAEGWLRTGDLGVLDADEYLHLVGRTKDSYRCGGEQVVPGDVETVLARHPSVHQAFVVPVPDDRRGEVGWAWIVPREGHAVDAEVLVAWCTEHLARFKVPRHVAEIAVADVPLTPSGRARKFLLAERAVSLL